MDSPHKLPIVFLFSFVLRFAFLESGGSPGYSAFPYQSFSAHPPLLFTGAGTPNLNFGSTGTHTASFVRSACYGMLRLGLRTLFSAGLRALENPGRSEGDSGPETFLLVPLKLWFEIFMVILQHAAPVDFFQAMGIHRNNVNPWSAGVRTTFGFFSWGPSPGSMQTKNACAWIGTRDILVRELGSNCRRGFRASAPLLTGHSVLK